MCINDKITHPAYKKSPMDKYKEITEIQADVSFMEYYGMGYLIDDNNPAKQKIMDRPYWNLNSIVAIDRKWLQRKLKEWEHNYTMKYFRDFFRGIDKVDNYVNINISKIIEIAKYEKTLLDKRFKDEKKNKRVKDKKKKRIRDNKVTIDDFIQKMQGYYDKGNRYVLVNGQHREDRWKALFDGLLPFPNDFIKVENYKIAGRKWWDLEEDARFTLSCKKHGITFVEDFKRISDLTHIVNVHNEGNEWNNHQKRIKQTSYIADEFQKLDDNDDVVKLFKTLQCENNYSLNLEGISFLATQLYYIWRNQKDDLYNLPGMKSKELESLVQIDGNWVKTDVDNFIRDFKSAVFDLNIFFSKQPKGAKFTFRKKISLLRNYFLFKMIITSDKTELNDSKYIVMDNDRFVAWWIQKETNRIMLYNRLTDAGKKEYKKLKQKKKITNESKIPKNIQKVLVGKFGLPKELDYTLSLNGVSSSCIKFVLGKQIMDFNESIENGDLNGIVNLKGYDVSSNIKNEVLASEISSLKKPTIDDIWDVLDMSQSDIEHSDVPKAKGGSHFVGNLGKANFSDNRSKQDRH
jgi:hypothetical protein|tara:strand:+ start:260 stop:1984 length:1725 start_codon:yes stop_codon:yes gene_type:complete